MANGKNMTARKNGSVALFGDDLSKGFENIGRNWRELVGWVKNSEFESACGQCLEGHILGSSETGDFELDLYMPIK